MSLPANRGPAKCATVGQQHEASAQADWGFGGCSSLKMTTALSSVKLPIYPGDIPSADQGAMARIRRSPMQSLKLLMFVRPSFTINVNQRVLRDIITTGTIACMLHSIMVFMLPILGRSFRAVYRSGHAEFLAETAKDKLIVVVMKAR